MRGIAIVILKLALISALYILFNRLGRRVDFVSENVRVLYPQAGVALAGMLLFGIRYWPAIFFSSLYLSYSELVQQAPRSRMDTFGLMASFAISNTSAAALGAYLMQRFGMFKRDMSRVSDVTALIVYGVIVAAAINATLAVVGFVFFGGLMNLPADKLVSMATILWFLRWFGTAISNLVVTPFFLVWFRRPTHRVSLLRIGEVALLCSLVLVICLTAFTDRSPLPALQYSLSFLPFPFLIWAALRFTQRGAAMATFIISVIAILGTSTGTGPFAPAFALHPGFASSGIISEIPAAFIVLQTYLTALALSAYFLAAATLERRHVVDRLRVSREELRALSARLQEAREQERANISREIHDELGQQLTGIKMVVSAFGKKVRALDPALEPRCTEISDLADQAVKTVRRIATDLRPGIIDDLGITASLQWLVEDFAATTGVAANFTTSVQEEPRDSLTSITTFRILQEALTNVTRHANAKSVDVTFDSINDELRLRVVDDGCGMDEARMKTDGNSGRPATLGLVGMRERARLAGGRIEIESAPGEGTTLTALLPRTPAISLSDE